MEIQLSLPAEMSGADRDLLVSAEMERGRQLKAAGTIVRMWRLPGRTANVGIWDAADATALHAAIESLPMFPHLSARVTALATHHLEA